MFKRENDLTKFPYYKERAVSPKNTTVSCKVPPEIKQELEKHFEKRYPDSESALSDGIRDLVYYYLNSISTERKSFNQFCYVAIAKSIDDDISGYTPILQVYSGKYDENKLEWRGETEKQLTVNQMLIEFGTLFDFDIEENTTLKQIVFNNNPDKFDFDILDVRDGTANVEDIDFDNYYFYRFKINNYLDVMENGEYGTKSLYYGDEVFIHKGLSIFSNTNDEIFGVYYSFFFDKGNAVVTDCTIVDKRFIDDIDIDFNTPELMYQLRHNSDTAIKKKIDIYPEEMELLSLYNEVNIYNKRISELEEKLKNKKQ